MNPIQRILLACALLAMSGAVWGQVATWELTGVNAATTNPQAATSLGSNIEAASLSLGSGVTASSGADTFGGNSFNNTSLSAAISDGDYLTFSITPASNYALSISSIVVNSGVSTAVTNFNVALLSSATGFASSDSLFSYNFSTLGAPTQSITLSGISSLQNATGGLEFRLYGWRDTSGTSTFKIRNLSGNDLVINGTASAIPEPSTYALLIGVVALAGTIIRRRRPSHIAT